MKFIKSFYMKLRIKYKIVLFLYLAIMMVSLILGSYTYLISQSYVTNKVSTSNMSVIAQISRSLDFFQKDIIDTSTYLCIDKTIQSLIEKQNNLGDSNLENQLNSDNSLKFILNVIAAKNYISSIILYGNDGYPIYYQFTDMSSGAARLEDIKQTFQYKKAMALRGSPYWFTIGAENQTFIQKNNFSKVVMCRNIKDFTHYSNVGFLMICVNEASLKSIYLKNLKSNEGILILDNSGNLVSKAGLDFSKSFSSVDLFKVANSKNEQGYLIKKIVDQNMLITYSVSKETGWRSFYAVPINNLTKEINSVKIYILIVIFACFVLYLPLALMISTILTLPIKKLLKSMKKFQEGNFDEKVGFKYGDEIGKLGEGYNSMVASIKELINNTYVLQIKEKEAELDALQSQINPHFLYNTLDTIFWKAQVLKDKDISEMVLALSTIFRLTLNRGKGTTLVSSEKKLVENYLILQKIRFKDKLNFSIDINPELMEYPIPKLILQPFVENSIIHGIEPLEKGGEVKITGCLENDKMCFTIQDNGIGMEKSKLLKVFSGQIDAGMNTESSISGGYAIKNIIDRLQIVYGEDYKIEIDSHPGFGTIIQITIKTNPIK